MKAVNCLTSYYLQKLLACEQELAADPKNKTLIDVYDGTKAAAIESGLPLGQAMIEAEKTAAVAVQMNLTVNMHSLIRAAASAGKVLCEIADPETVKIVKTLMTPEELKEAAKKATVDLTNLLMTLNELLPLVDKMIDAEHVAEQILLAARKRREEQSGTEPTVKAKQAHGTPVPFGKRIEPSSN